MKVTYNVKESIDIMFDQMKMGQDFTIAGKPPFSDRQLTDMGVAKTLATRDYTHVYCMWKSITAEWLHMGAVQGAFPGGLPGQGRA